MIEITLLDPGCCALSLFRVLLAIPAVERKETTAATSRMTGKAEVEVRRARLAGCRLLGNLLLVGTGI